MNSNHPHQHSFPLEQLFLRLKMSGFALSPADRLRALQVLNGPAKGYLNEPELLKKLLAPALVRNAAEQEKFYEIFDLYFKEVNRPLEHKEEVLPQRKPWWIPWLIMVTVVGLLAYMPYLMKDRISPSSQLSVYIEGPTYASIGDTVSYLNLSEYRGDSSELKFLWEYGTPGQKAELLDSTHFNWSFAIPDLINNIFQKEIRLSVYHPEKDSTYTSRFDLSIFCPSAPAVNKIIGNKQLVAGESETYTVSASKSDLDIITDSRGRQIIDGPAKNWVFDWDFGDGTIEKNGQYFTAHQYAENGLYKLRLTVTDTTGQGYCSTSHSLDVKVGVEQAYLPLAQLREDKLKPIAVWNWAYFVLLGVLGIGIIYHWVKWLTRPKNKTKEQTETPAQKVLKARFELNDKAPYFIPLRDQDYHIRSSTQQLDFADALRLRQTGLRKEIDVNETLNSTIDRGGFPNIQYRFASQASEYLFLIDEQNRASHQGRLFKYLAESLADQDVNMEIFHYRLHFNRFWNPYHPNGLTLDQLHKAFSNYRLVILGDLHEIIDPHAKAVPHLRPEVNNVLKQWPQRLLLTPVPPISWSYREKLLAKLFNIFPADSDGIADAALHLENDIDLSSSTHSFDTWKEEQSNQRKDSDTEHRKWKRWPDIENYLSIYDPILTRWFKSLAVFPMINWEMTIAIGHALGIQITYDKLLQLARIPALQQDRFDERLRQKLLSILDQNDEKIAREAVRIELEAVKSISTNSAASKDLETSLAIQSFSLDPEAEENQDTIRFLLETGMLNHAQEKELDWVSSKHLEQQSPQTKGGISSKKPAIKTREWLKTGEYISETKPDTQKDNRFNKDFWKALLLTIAYTLLLVGGWKLGGSDTLYNLVFWESPDQRKVGSHEPLRDYFFVKENLIIDSAIINNNWGVERSGLAETQDTSTAHYFQEAMLLANPVLKGNGEEFQGKTIPYSLANANLSKLYYNIGVNYLNHFLNDSLGQTVLAEAITVLDKAYISDSMALDVMHAKGVVHYYMGSPEDSLQSYYQSLDTLGYFDNIDYTPNLKTLLGRERSRIINENINKNRNTIIEVVVDYYRNDVVDTDLFITATPIGTGQQPQTQSFDLVDLIGTKKFTFTPPSDSPGKMTSVLIEMHRRPSNTIIDSKKVSFNHNWSVSKTNTSRPEPNTELTSFSISGQVIDDINRKGIPNAVVTLSEPPTRSTKKIIQLETTTDEYGNFRIEGKEILANKNLNLTTYKDGYKEIKTLYSGKQIRALSIKESLLIRLKARVPNPKMALINGGQFVRIDESDGPSKTGPTRQRVTLNNFYLGTYEVTYAEYDLFCEMTTREKADDNGWGRGQRPVSQISWSDAVDYCNWLSEQHGYQAVYGSGNTINSSANGYRLPTEAEWEYAARGGIMADQSHIYAGSSNINEVAWYDANSQNKTQPVGQKQPNNAGLYDMSGNVWEWCHDWYSPYPRTPQTNPKGSDYGSDRILRGGAWIQQAADCRIDLRRYTKPYEKHSWLGFRLARNN